MFEPSRFVPASLDAFRRAARDLQRAYALPLQRSQEALARIYAYPDLHALQEHLKQGPVAGPFDEEIDARDVDRRDYIADITLANFLGGAIPCAGHLGASDLRLFASPEARRAHMDFEHSLESVAKGLSADIDPSPISDYMTFEVREASFMLGIPLREGVFRLTRKGLAIRRMVTHLVTCSDDGRSLDEEMLVMKSLFDLSIGYPSDPLAKAELARLEHSMMLNFAAAGSGSEPDRDIARMALQRCRAVKLALESMMPSRFNGQIEPALVGDGIQNEPYMTALSVGMECAYLLEQERTAKAWGRKYLRLHPRDSFGVRFILTQLGVDHPSARREESASHEKH